MADVNANIGVNIDTSDALNQLKNLQRQISQFHQSVARTSATAAASQKDLQKNFINSINSIEGFSAELKTVRSTAESFTDALEKNKFSMRQYFRYSAGATKTFGKNFVSEFNTIERTAIERVKTLQTQYVKMGRDATGAMQAIAIRPTVLNMKDLGTQTAIAAQKQVLFNQLVKQGSTNLLNFGKNTQWAGRQLMVGFTIPLAVFGSMASQTFMKLEEEMIKFKKVYGDLLTNEEETKDAIDQINRLAEAYTKYGVSVTETFRIAGDAAAAGFSGLDLQRQTEQAIRLSILGQLDQKKALETTISLQNAFRLSSDELAESINFLNAVENQSVVALDDITTAIPKVAPVIQALGGNVKDLAFFIAAMKESGVAAAEGANALKSSLGRLVNPSKAASDYLRTLGIDVKGIVDKNAGNLQGMIFEIGQALDTLDPLSRSRAIERLFGKFQFARMSALFDNINREGSQAARVLDLSQVSIEELSDAAEKELGVSAASAMNEFRGAVERLNIALAPIGELFLQVATPFVEFATKALESFNKLPEGIKKNIGLIITVIGGIAPIALMAFGLVNNLIANIIKFFATSRIGYLKLTGQAQGVGDEIQYMTQEHMQAAAAAASLDQAHSNLIQRFTMEKVAVDQLRTAYEQAVAAGARFATINPGMMRPGFSPTGYNKGGVVSVGGTGNKDTQPALLTPGEAVIPAGMVKKYQPLIQGMIAGNIPGYADGVMLGMPKTSRGVSKHRDAAEQIYEMFLKSSYANTIPTEYGHQISPTSGHSFPIFGLGGVYQKGNKQVFVKPVLDEKAAIAEMRSNEISRKAHGLEAPEQRIVVIRDPLDLSGKRRFLALESDLDPKFVNEKPMGLFNEDQYFRQLVASLLRVDKDLSGSNVFGNVVADAGPAGVFGRASGLRDYEKDLPSMEEQAIVNLLGIKGGAKRAFAESTLGLMAGLTPEQYHQRMLGEIQKVIPALQQTIASFQLTDPTEVGIYDDMVRRLQEGLGVDWSKFHAIHSAVKIPKPKAATQAAKIPGYKDGVVSVPGPKGAGDVTPAMLSPGEAVIPTAMAKKYAPLINAMIAGSIPGYRDGVGSGSQGRVGKSIATVQRTFSGNVAASSGLVGFSAINPEDLADLASIYMPQIIKQAKVSVAAINREIDEWARENIAAINLATEQVNAGTDPAVAFAPLTQKFKTDMETLNGSVSRLMTTFEQMTPQLQADLREAQEYAARFNLDIKASAADAERLRSALPNNRVAQMVASPGPFAGLSRARQASTAILGEAGAISEKGSARFMLTPGLHPSELAYKGASSQEHFSTTEVQEQQRIRLAAQRVAQAQSQAFASGLISAAEDGLGIESASKEFGNISKQVTAGVKLGEDDAKKAGEGLARATTEAVESTVKTTGPRRASTNPEITAALEAARQQPDTQSSRGSRRFSAPQTNLTPEITNIQAIQERQKLQQQQQISEAAKIQLNNIRDFSGKLSSASFAMSSLTGILSIFGADLGGIMPVISGVTGAMFALSSATSVLTQAKSAQIIAERVEQAKGLGNLFTELKGGQKGLKGIQNIIGRVSGAFKTMFPVLSKLIVPLAIAGTLFAAWQLYTKVQEEAKFKIEGLGNVATLTADKIKKLGQIFNVEVIETAFESAKPIISATGTAPGQEQRSLIQQVKESENFAEDFKNEIRAIKESGKEEAELALKALAVKLTGKGFAKEQIEAIVGALVTEAGRTDVKLDFGSIDLNIQTNRAVLEAQLEQQTKALSEAYEGSFQKIRDEQEKEAKTQGFGIGYLPNDAGSAFVYSAIARSEELMDQDLKTRAHTLGAVFQGLFIGLSGQFQTAKIDAEAFNERFAELSAQIASMPTPEGLLLMESIMKILPDETQEVIKGLGSIEDQLAFIKAASLGLDISSVLSSEEIAAIAAGGTEGAAALKKLTIETNKFAAAVEKANKPIELTPAELIDAATLSLREQIEKLQDQKVAFNALTKAGIPAADAIKLLGNESLLASIKASGLTPEIKALVETLIELEKSAPSVSSGGGKLSPFQEAIENLKKQKEEIKNNIVAYSGLRKSGFGVAEAARLASDSLTAAALASQKIGSEGYKKLLAEINAVRKAQNKLLRSTPQGGTQLFNEAYSKLSNFFNTQEALLESSNRAATATNRALIETLEAQIETYNRQIGAFQKDLEKIAEQEDAINKTYDEKEKALERVKKLNQDILNQQKSQLSVADALSRGDVSAAAAAMQEARSQNAAAQGDAAKTALDAARQGQLDALKENGLSRAEIEAKIKKLKDDIYNIEVGSLRTAKDSVEAADKALQSAISLLSYKGRTREQWEKEKMAVEAAQAKAELYERGVFKALKSAENLVKEWGKLNTTIKTKHVIETVYTGSGAPANNTTATTATGSAAAAAALRKLQSGSNLTNKERALLGMAPNKKAAGGYISGPGTATSDSIPAMLSDGEYVIRAASVNKFGKNFLDAINAGKLTGFRLGDLVSYMSMGGMIKLPKREAPPPQMSKGGMVPKYFAGGGMVPKYFGGGGMAKKYAKGGDVVPAMLTPGEFVMSKSATDAYAPLLNSLNSGALGNLISSRQFNKPVYNMPERDYASLGGSAMTYSTSESAASPTAIDNSVYNYSLSVNVEGTDASANDIANVVINKIKNIQSQQVRRQVLR